MHTNYILRHKLYFARTISTTTLWKYKLKYVLFIWKRVILIIWYRWKPDYTHKKLQKTIFVKHVRFSVWKLQLGWKFVAAFFYHRVHVYFFQCLMCIRVFLHFIFCAVVALLSLTAVGLMSFICSLFSIIRGRIQWDRSKASVMNVNCMGGANFFSHANSK